MINLYLEIGQWDVRSDSYGVRRDGVLHWDAELGSKVSWPWGGNSDMILATSWRSTTNS